MTDVDLTLKFQHMTEAKAEALAQFVKRNEAYVMRDALVDLQSALADEGYEPR